MKNKKRINLSIEVIKETLSSLTKEKKEEYADEVKSLYDMLESLKEAIPESITEDESLIIFANVLLSVSVFLNGSLMIEAIDLMQSNVAVVEKGEEVRKEKESKEIELEEATGALSTFFSEDNEDRKKLLNNININDFLKTIGIHVIKEDDNQKGE